MRKPLARPPFSPAYASLPLSAHTLDQLRTTALSFVHQAWNHPEYLQRYLHNPIGVFLEVAPRELERKIPKELQEQANLVLLADAPSALRSIKRRRSLRMAGKWKQTLCEIGLWSALVLALGSVSPLSHSSLITQLITADRGVLPILAAVTGLSQQMITTLATSGAMTLHKLILTACSQV